MGEIGKALIIPTSQDIISLNLYHIKKSGGLLSGTDNLKNLDSLEWVLEAIRYPLFGIQQFPTVVEKVAILTWVIIEGHVFNDGNKRTGISTLKIFLKVNNYDLNASSDELIDIALKIADSTNKKYTFEEFVLWIRERLVLIKDII
jgi:death-on-curing protein